MLGENHSVGCGFYMKDAMFHSVIITVFRSLCCGLRAAASSSKAEEQIKSNQIKSNRGTTVMSQVSTTVGDG